MSKNKDNINNKLNVTDIETNPDGVYNNINNDSEKNVYKRLQTLDNINNNNIYNKYIQNLLKESDNETDVISLRVPKKIKLLYVAMPLSFKKEIKEIFIRTIEGFVKHVNEERKIINININLNYNKLDTNITNIDPELLLKKVKMLEEQKKEAKEIIKYYENEITLLKKDKEELRKQLQQYNQKNRQLQEKIQRIKSYLKWIEDDPKIIRNILMNIKEILGVS